MAKTKDICDAASKQRFLFRFGFCPPKLYNYHSEESMWCFIVAFDEQSAFEWGMQIAERFNEHLFTADTSWREKIPSWKEGEYAHWIEKENLPSDIDDIPVVACGELPNFEGW